MKLNDRITELEKELLFLKSQNQFLQNQFAKDSDVNTSHLKTNELIDSEVRYKALADATSEAVFIMENGKCIDLNEKASEIYGYTYEEAIGIPLLNLIAPESKDLVLEKFSMEYAAPYEGWCIRKNGEIFPAELRGKNFDYKGRKVRISTIRDISLQKQAELELAKSEAKFRSYFEDHKAIKLQIDVENKRIADVNSAAIEFYGYSKEELLEKTIFDLNALPKDEVLDLMKKAKSGEESSFSFPHKLKNGEIRDVKVYTTLIEVDGRDYFFSILHDVTEGKKAEDNLRRSEARFRAYFENNTAAMLQIDPQSKCIIEANKAAVEFYGYSCDRFKKMKIYDLNKLSPAGIDKKMQEVMTSPSQMFIFEHLLASGVMREVEVYVSPVVTETDHQLFITAYDVSEREENKRALLESERKLAEAQSISKLGHFEYNLITREVDWSDEFCRIFGFDSTNKNAEYEKYRARIHPEDINEQDNIFNQALKEKRAYTLNYRIITYKGEAKYIEEKGHFEFDENQEVIKIVGTMQDITFNYLIKKDLEESKEALALINNNLEIKVKAELDKSREKDHLIIQQSRQAVLGELIGNIAHQWRQPLNEVSILINDLEDAFSFGVLNKEYFEKTVKTVYRRIKFMSDTISDFSKMHTDDFKKEVFSPKELIEKLIKFTEGTIKKNKIQIRFMYNVEFEAIGYPNMLSHVVLNLLNNSRDTLFERNIKRPKIWIKLEKNDTEYNVYVLDNGKGIESGVINKIFDPYFSTKDKMSGSGLGLYMAKSMIEKQMHGQIEVQNKAEGAEFKITLGLRSDKYE